MQLKFWGTAPLILRYLNFFCPFFSFLNFFWTSGWVWSVLPAKVLQKLRFIFAPNIRFGFYFPAPARWLNGNVLGSGTGGLRLKSRAGQIGHSVANGSPGLRYFFKRSCVARRRNGVEMDLANLCNTTSIMNELSWSPFTALKWPGFSQNTVHHNIRIV